jgi:eukaryotic-like serine/threonine-protein kinase
MPVNSGQILQNRYRIVKLIGQGGFGAVYRAWDMNLNQPCAVKENLDVSAEAQKQFGQEMGLLRRLHHNSLPRIYDYFFLSGVGQYMVMDFIEGQDLQTMLAQRGCLPEAEVIPWIRQICDALSYMHSQKPAIIHRDIKPANIIVTSEGRAMLVDFGISKVHDPLLKTTVGARAVTPGFSPWEQYGQSGTDNRSDIYALGATLYALLTGQEPPESILLVGGGTSLTPPQRLNPAIAPHVGQAIERALQSRPTDRFASANDLPNALQTPPYTFTPPPQTQLAQAPAPTARQAAPRQPAPPAKKTPSSAPAIPIWAWGSVAAAVLLLLLMVAFSAIRGHESANNSLATATPLTPVAADIAVTTTVAPLTPAAVDMSSLPLAEGRLGDTWVRPIDGMVMVYVPAPAASFKLGSGLDAPTESYWIDKYEVTNAQYQLCVAAGACNRSALDDDSRFNGANHPVVGVSWHEAAAYSAWVGGALPTEEEWEYAAAGEANTEYPWGNEFDGTRLNFCDVNCPFNHRDRNWDDGYADTAPVGSYPSGESWVGAADMAGNVWEWTDSWWEAGQPWRVVRGGSFDGASYDARAAYRYAITPDSRHRGIGFRVVVVRRPPSHP